MKAKYIVDERVGCIAVRDSEVECESPGLNPDLPGIVKFWNGYRNRNGWWYLEEGSKEEAKALCDELNEAGGPDED